jgi:hypothetical protein
LPGNKSLQRLFTAISDWLFAHAESGLSACARKFPGVSLFCPEPESFKETCRLIEARSWYFWKSIALGAQACPTSCKY